ncbi:MAG: spore maturation protein, partial [Betaproteobacteria bacterium]|nr:spore maturation protein [Betaproteobacteria bacterium]
MIASSSKFLVLDGIGDIPFGREFSESLRAEGHVATHVYCRKQPTRALYKIRSAYAKVINKQQNRDSFYLLPRATSRRLQTIIETERPD